MAAELTSRDPRWQISRHTLGGGKQQAVTIVTINNGAIEITVCPTRGMSILEVRDATSGLRLFGWDSPVKEVVHPQYVQLGSRGGLGWLDGFNEWLVRCGLEFAGAPGIDQFVTNTGEVAEMELTLHGKIANLPASTVELLRDDATGDAIRLRGMVHERMFLGPKLTLVTDLIVRPGSLDFELEDAVTNQGGADQEFQLIYHINFGAPLLEAESRVAVPARKVLPRNAHSAGPVDRWQSYQGPQAGFVEQVYFITPYADEAGTTCATLHNANLDRGAVIAWSTEALPSLTLWKNTAAFEDGYVTGIEPGTGFPNNRRVERQAGRVPKLSPGETRQFRLGFRVLSDRDQVQSALGQVAAIANGRATQIVREPPDA
jgi:galactose mutarotase-like enzyme